MIILFVYSLEVNMKKAVIVVLAIFFLFNINVFSVNKNSNKDITGIWQGKLNIQGFKLRIVFHIKKDKEKLIATMDSPDQGAKGIKIDKVIYQENKIELIISSINGKYEGIIKSDKISGKWSQNGMTFPLNLKKSKKAFQVKRPQEPKKPYPYSEEEVVIYNKKAKVKLSGTLTIPEGKGPFPAVILITGSGPQDRNETIFGHKPFLVISDFLTRRGIAVLRTDDRGVGKSTGNLRNSTTLELAEDVLYEIDFLKTHKKIDKNKIGLIGHSEGGIIAPIVATKTKDVAFIVLMAGTGLTGEKILYLQSRLISKAEGVDEKRIEDNLKLQKKLFNIIKNEKSYTLTKTKLRKILNEEFSKLSDKEKKQIKNKDKYINKEINQLTSPWFRFFLTYDPYQTLIKVKCPVLAINGEKDLQVPPDINLKKIKHALTKAGNKDFLIKKLKGLNHLFQTAKTGALSEYPKIEETISPIALNLIYSWIRKHI